MFKETKGRRLTSREAARVLGVSEASVKRWADGGLLPMEKTAGGHRRFRPEDVAAVRRGWLSTREAPLDGRRVALAVLDPQATALTPEREAMLAEETFRALLDGSDEELASLLVSLHLHGQSVGQLADGLLCAAMRRDSVRASPPCPAGWVEAASMTSASVGPSTNSSTSPRSAPDSSNP